METNEYQVAVNYVKTKRGKRCIKPEITVSWTTYSGDREVKFVADEHLTVRQAKEISRALVQSPWQLQERWVHMKVEATSPPIIEDGQED